MHPTFSSLFCTTQLANDACGNHSGGAAICILHPRGAHSAPRPRFDGEIAEIGRIGARLGERKLSFPGQPEREHQIGQAVFGRGMRGRHV